MRAEFIAISAVSPSRISPIIIMSGSWRRADLNPLKKVYFFGIDLCLDDAGQMVFNRVFNSYYFNVRRMYLFQNA